MILRCCLAVLLLLPTLSLCAGSVSEAEARQKVQTFLQQRGKKTSSQRVKLMKKGRRTGTPASSVGYYLFNLGETDGFVIVSGDDRTTAILGYADSGSIHEDDMPDGLRYLLQGYEEQMANIPADAGAPVHRSSRTFIEPLIKTRWNQGNPYNYLCPLITGKHAVTGCVATSFAQLMYYHKYPTESCAPIPAYSTNTQDKDGKKITLDVPALPATTFEWDNMIDDYNPINPETGKKYVGGTDAQQAAVATLMQYCGSSIEMMYGLGTSSAYNEAIPFALKTYFGYDGGITHAYRKNYSYAEWIDLIYSELVAKRPVILGGQAAGGGHSFICDGYDTNDHAGADGDYFHMNWGWGGSSDGYFLLSVLQPWEQGIGGSSTLDGFSFGQDVVFGIQPPVGGNADYCMSLEGLHLGGSDATLSSKTYSRTSSTDDFTGISIFYDVWNYYYGSHAFDVALQLQDGSGNVVQTFDFCENRTMSWNINYSATVQNIAIPHTVADGTYYVKAMSRLHGDANDANWQECYDGNAYKMTATISGNELTMTVPIPGNVPPLSVDFQVTGNLRYGSEQAVTATITGSGAGVYNGDVVLRVNGTAVMGKVVNIAAGESLDLQFSFIPSKAGCNTLTLWSKRSGGSQITGSMSVDITLPLSNNGDNSEAIAQNAGVITDVILDGRTLYKDGGWNTICLPFNVTLSGSVLDGADVRRLSSTEFSNGTLTLNFTDENEVTELEAGKPYIIRWASGENLVSPVFTSVTISNATKNTSTTYVDFIGTTSPFDFTANDNTKLFVGSENKLYYPNADMTLGACRAYFQLKGITAADVSGARMSFDEGNDEVTSLNLTPALSQGEGAWYTLDGRKVANGQKPSQRHTLTERIAKGLYIHHGKKVVK